MEFDNIGIVLTDDCNARCEMCCAGRPELQANQHTLTPDELDLILGRIREQESITYVGLTGGEPMIHQDLVQQVCDYDFGRPISISIKTNGSWGRNPQKAEDFLTRNKDTIKYLSFSYDEFHCRYISLDAIKNVIDIAWDLRIPTDIIGCFLKNSMTPGEILDMLGEHAYKCRFGYQPVMRTGLAANIPEEKFIRPYRADKNPLPCSALSKHTLLVNTHLDVYPCCSQIVEGTILKVGNLAESSLSDIIEHMGHNRLLVALFHDGLSSLLSVAREEEDCPTEFSTPCEACEYLFRDARFLERINDALVSQDKQG